MTLLNETHDPALRSWVASANLPSADFTVQNLPFGVFRRRDNAEAWRGGVAIGDQVLDLVAARSSGAFTGEAAAALALAAEPTLNAFMGAGANAWRALRLGLSRALREGSSSQAALPASLVSSGPVQPTSPLPSERKSMRMSPSSSVPLSHAVVPRSSGSSGPVQPGSPTVPVGR